MRKLILCGLFEVAESGRDHDDLVRCANAPTPTIAFLGMGGIGRVFACSAPVDAWMLLFCRNTRKE